MTRTQIEANCAGARDGFAAASDEFERDPSNESFALMVDALIPLGSAYSRLSQYKEELSGSIQ